MPVVQNADMTMVSYQACTDMGDTVLKLNIANVLLTIKDLQSEGKAQSFHHLLVHATPW